MHNRKKLELLKQKQEENICDICGAPNALLRTFTNDGIIVDELSGFTCQECLGREKEYVETLADDLDINQELRGQLAERFQNIRLDKKNNFTFEYGLGVEHEKCEVCGQGHSYLHIVEYHCDDKVETLYEISGFYCAECSVTGIQETHTVKAIRDLIMFRKECEDATKKYEFFKSIMGTSQFKKEMKNFTSAFKRCKELQVQEAMYKRKAELMEKARLDYEGTPVKVEIRTAREGNICCLCGKIYGKDCKCGKVKKHPKCNTWRRTL